MKVVPRKRRGAKAHAYEEPCDKPPTKTRQISSQPIPPPATEPQITSPDVPLRRRPGRPRKQPRRRGRTILVSGTNESNPIVIMEKCDLQFLKMCKENHKKSTLSENSPHPSPKIHGKQEPSKVQKSLDVGDKLPEVPLNIKKSYEIPAKLNRCPFKGKKVCGKSNLCQDMGDNALCTPPAPATPPATRRKYVKKKKTTSKDVGEKVLKQHHRDTERSRHQALSAQLDSVCEGIIGPVTITKIGKIKSLINYIYHLENNIKQLYKSFGMDLEKIFISQPDGIDAVKLSDPGLSLGDVLPGLAEIAQFCDHQSVDNELDVKPRYNVLVQQRESTMAVLHKAVMPDAPVKQPTKATDGTKTAQRTTLKKMSLNTDGETSNSQPPSSINHAPKPCTEGAPTSTTDLSQPMGPYFTPVNHGVWDPKCPTALLENDYCHSPNVPSSDSLNLSAIQSASDNFMLCVSQTDGAHYGNTMSVSDLTSVQSEMIHESQYSTKVPTHIAHSETTNMYSDYSVETNFANPSVAAINASDYNAPVELLEIGAMKVPESQLTTTQKPQQYRTTMQVSEASCIPNCLVQNSCCTMQALPIDSQTSNSSQSQELETYSVDVTGVSENGDINDTNERYTAVDYRTQNDSADKDYDMVLDDSSKHLATTNVQLPSCSNSSDLQHTEE